MKIIAVIPARLEASRFPGKLMQLLGDKTVIAHTYQNIVSAKLFSEVIVATDNDSIQNEIEAIGGEVFKSIKNHECGSDRIAEAILYSSADLVINIQGDEPFINQSSLSALLNAFDSDSDKQIDLASLMIPLTDKEEIENPNNVKVIVDQDNFALYFSRSPIPYYRSTDISKIYYKHIGVYAFRRQALIDFSNSQMTPLERVEKIECIRYLEQGKKIKMVLSNQDNIGIDTPEDLVKAQQFLNNKY
tara:strand:- start:715 stop:1452 length:738 start_codon:yes stop_codon:yes gene_type:complete